MRAFDNTAVNKDTLIGALRAFRFADRIVQGHYWEDDTNTGCAVGASLAAFEARPDDHFGYERLFGIPAVLARLEDEIFEALPPDDAADWPLRFISAIRPGSDLSAVWPQFAHWLITDDTHGLMKVIGDNAQLPILAGLYARQAAGEDVAAQDFRDASTALMYASDVFPVFLYGPYSIYARYAGLAFHCRYSPPPVIDPLSPYARKRAAEKEAARLVHADRLIALLEAAP